MRDGAPPRELSGLMPKRPPAVLPRTDEGLTTAT
jgi:hypothetical protein